MTYPSDIYEQRSLENLPGLEYDPLNKKTLFAEDILALGAEVNAIENTLGINAQSDFDTVSDRIEALETGGGGGGGFLYEKKILASSANTIVFDTPISMDELTYLKLQYIIPGNIFNSNVRLLFENDTTTANYMRTMQTVNAYTQNISTSQSSILGQIGSSSIAGDSTISWQFELRKLPGKYLNVKCWQSTNGASDDTGFKQTNLVYKGTVGDITDIKFKVDTFNFPVGTVAILSGV